MPSITIKVDCVINPNGIEVAYQFLKLGLILEELIEQRKVIKNKAANLAQYVAV